MFRKSCFGLMGMYQNGRKTICADLYGPFARPRNQKSGTEFRILVQPFEFHLEMFFPYTLADLRGGNCTYSIEITRSVTVKESHNFIHTGAERNVGLASESCCPDLILNYPS